MAIRAVLEFPDPRLHEASAPVTRFDDSVAATAEDLIDTMVAHGSIGLSAPQVDDRRQILVMDHSPDQDMPEVFVNPVILQKARYGIVEERCLSVPDVVAHVFRATELRIQACTVKGEAFETTLSGMPAVCLQHEMDHFDGKLLADRINWFRRRRLLARIDRRAASPAVRATGEQPDACNR